MLAVAALGMMVGAAGAQQNAAGLQHYDVELIVFRTLSSGATPELWAMEAVAAGQQLALPEDDPDPMDPVATPTPTTTQTFPAVPPGRLKLTAVEEALRRSRNYQPLAHIAWTQPGYPRNAARYIPIAALAPSVPGLSGQVALSRGRYLHLTLDLALDDPAVDGEPQQRYVLRQTRRMRSNERHYLDHPKFGVIALVTPVQND